MKRVLVVTKISRNYGALLQAYALKRTLEKMNAEVQILNLNNEKTVRSFQVFHKVSGIHTLGYFLNEAFVYSQRKAAINRSLRFRDEWLNLTESYPCYEAVVKNPPKADVYLTGSDQVWNPVNSFDKSYYLLFGQEETVRASYAASIALEEIPEMFQEDFPKRVRNVEHISVREESGRRLLAQYGIDAQVHLDPTLLLDRKDYEKLLVKPELKEPYVLLYMVLWPKEPEKIVERIRAIYPGRKVVLLIGEARVRHLGDIQILDAGPREFLGLFRYADAIVTTSFHGTVFSCVFEKEFAVMIPSGVGSRITNLLKMADMEKHIVSSAAQISNDVLCQEHNIFDAPQMMKKREESLTYLQSVLNSASKSI